MKRTLIPVNGVKGARAHILWQESNEGVPEQALYLRRGDGDNTMFIQQGEAYLNLNVETIPLLCALLKSMGK